MIPTNFDIINQATEHFGLPKQKVIEILRVPTHPHGLRDDFAAAALQGLCANPNVSAFSQMGHVTCTSYELADAMLTCRARAK